MTVEIDPDPVRIDRDVVRGFLSTEAYWARRRTRADVETQLVDAVLDGHPRIRWVLFTDDAHGLYAARGFEPAGSNCMVRPGPAGRG